MAENKNGEGTELSPKEAAKQAAIEAKAKKKAVKPQWWVKLFGIFAPIASIALSIVAGITLADKAGNKTIGIVLLIVAVVLAIFSAILCMVAPSKKGKRKFIFGFVISLVAFVVTPYPVMMMLSNSEGGGTSGTTNPTSQPGPGGSTSDPGTTTGDPGTTTTDNTSTSEVDPGLLFTYALNTDGESYAIKGLTNLGHSTPILNVPASHDGKPVTTIGSEAFKRALSSEAVNTVNLPSSITTLERKAFYGSFAETLNLGDTQLTEIPNYAFNLCGAKNINLPASVTAYGDYAFSESQIETFTIGNNVKTIGQYAFYKCSALTSITLGDSVEEVGRSAFAKNEALTTLTIGANTPYFSASFVDGCTALSYYEDGGMKFLGNEAHQHLVLVECSSYYDMSLQIPTDCEEIGPYAFNENQSIRTFEAPASVKYIAESAFRETSLVTLTFAEGSKIERIGTFAFWNSSLANVTLPEGIKTVEESFKMTSITSFNIPSTLEIAEDDLFSYFLQTYSLREINVAENHPTLSSVDGILYNKDKSKLLRVGNGKVCQSSEFVVPSVAPTIGKYAIVYPESNVTIVIPSSITTIESAAFRDGQQHIRQGELVSDSRHIIGIQYQGSTAEWEAVTKSMEKGYEWVSASDEGGIQSLRFHTVECYDGSVETYSA